MCVIDVMKPGTKLIVRITLTSPFNDVTKAFRFNFHLSAHLSRGPLHHEPFLVRP